MKKFLSKLLILSLTITFLNYISWKTVTANTYSDASQLSFDDKWSDNLFMNDGNRDIWYKVVIPSDGIWNFKIMSYSSNMVLYTLYDNDIVDVVRESSNRLQGGSDTSPVSISETIAMTEGIYYLNLHLHEEGDLGAAKIKIKSSFEKISVNDKQAVSFDSPQTIRIGESITGILGKTDLEDWFKFTLKTDTTLIFRAKSYCDTFFTYDFYDEDAQIVQNGSNALQGGSDLSPASEIKEYTFTKGSYYLKIMNYNRGDGGNYEFSLSKKKPQLVQNSITLKKGEKYKIKILNLFGDKATYKSTQTKVATVNKSGTVTAKKRGKTTIIITIRNQKLKCYVKVK